MASLLSFILQKIDCICNKTLQVYLIFSFGLTIDLPSSLKHVSSFTFVLRYSSPLLSYAKSLRTVPNFFQYIQKYYKLWLANHHQV